MTTKAKLDPTIQGQNTDYATGVIKGALGTVGTRAAPQAGGIQLGQAAQVDPTQQAQFRAGQLAQVGQLPGDRERSAGRRGRARRESPAGAGDRGAAVGGGQRAHANAMLRAARPRATPPTWDRRRGPGGAGTMQDQAQAQGLLAQALGQGRGQDLTMAGQNAGFQQERMLQQGQLDSATQLANLHAQLTQNGMNDQAALAYPRS